LQSLHTDFTCILHIRQQMQPAEILTHSAAQPQAVAAIEWHCISALLESSLCLRLQEVFLLLLKYNSLLSPQWNLFCLSERGITCCFPI